MDTRRLSPVESVSSDSSIGNEDSPPRIPTSPFEKDSASVRAPPPKQKSSNSILSFMRTSLNKLVHLPQIKMLEGIFGSGVPIPSEVETSLARIMSTLNCPDLATEIRNASRNHDFAELSLIKQRVLAEAENKGIPLEELAPFRELIDSLVEHCAPEFFNTQYRHEYLPRLWMTSKERSEDGELRRETVPVKNFELYLEKLSPDDPRQQTFREMMKQAELSGFERYTGYNIYQPSEMMAARLYGIKRTEEGFESILGIAHGDRWALGTNAMKWPYQTTDAQNLAMMKMLRQLEKSEPATAENFNSAYQNHGAALGLSDSQKTELQEAMIEFANERTRRIQKQLEQINAN